MENRAVVKRTVQTIFSKFLKEDTDLKLSNADFGKIILASVPKTNRENVQEKINELKKTFSYPSNYVLASLAYRSYDEDKRIIKAGEDLHGQEVEGKWKLLTYAHNKETVLSILNGYMGAAYWNPSMQQVVIAHSGTSNFGGNITGLTGVVLNMHVEQIDSALTFTYKVISVLKKVNESNGLNIQLFFTGHSLGAWIAPITAFSAKYLVKHGDYFLASDDFEKTGYHSSTVIFDGPGSRNMLETIQGKLMKCCNSQLIDSLDITNFLTMPNLVNSCSCHVGEMYKIFLNLTEEEKKNVQKMSMIKYTSFSHSMIDIKRAFHPKNKNLKIKKVLLWPLLFSYDLFKFFKLVNSSNEFDLDEKNPCFTIISDKVQYRSEDLTEDIKNQHKLCVFTKFECQFIEIYKSLEEHQKKLLIELKFENLFSCLQENPTIKNRTLQMLKECRVENGFIYSENLQEFIPFLKLILHLFPEMKQEAEEACQNLPSHILSTFYESASCSYIKFIENSLKIESNDTHLRNFLETETFNSLLIVDSNTFLGSIRMFNAFKTLENCYKNEKNNIFLSLNGLLHLGDLLFVAFLKNIKEKFLLVVECDYMLNNKIEAFLTVLFKVLEDKSNIKVILIAEKNSELSEYLMTHNETNELFCKNFIPELQFKHLSSDSQEQLLDKRTVIFQGKEVLLSKVVDRNDSDSLDQIMDSETILGLFKNERIEIGKPLPTLDQTENFFIRRRLIKKVKLRENFGADMPNDLFVISNTDKDSLAKLVKEKNVCNFEDNNDDIGNPIRFIALKSENDENCFETLCDSFKQNNLHWIKLESNKDFIWQRSYGNLDGLRKCIESYDRDLIESEYSESNTSINIIEVDNINNFKEKFIIIAAEPGMGKTTALTHLGTQTKDDDSKWYIRINLAEKKSKLEVSNFSEISSIVDFLHGDDNSNIISIMLAKRLLRHRLTEKGNLILLLDGFDEINEKCQTNVVQLLKTMKSSKIEKLFISTRLHLRELLENTLSTFAYSFKPFSEDNQKQFLKKFWQKDMFRNIDKECLDQYIQKTLKFISKSIRDKEKTFMGIPLQMRMIAEAFQEGLKPSSHCSEHTTFPKIFDMLQLYKRFVEVKYQIYFQRIGEYANFTKVQKALFSKELNKMHMRIAIKILFPKEVNDFVGKKLPSDEEVQEMKKVGIIQLINNKIVFVHTTFAEYFVAKFLSSKLNKEDGNIQKYNTTLEFLARELFKSKNEVIKSFLDYGLAEKKTHSITLRGGLNGIEDIKNVFVVDALGRSALHYASQEEHRNIVVALKKKGALCKADLLGKTPLHYAARYNHEAQVTSYLLDSFKGCVNVKDKNEHTALFYAVQQSNWDIVDRILIEKDVNVDDINKQMLLFRYACNGNLQSVKTVTQQGKVKNFILIKDNRGNTLLHIAAQKGNVDIVKFLLKVGSDINIDNNAGKRPITCAAENNQWDTVECLINDCTDLSYIKEEQKILLLQYAVKKPHWKTVKLFMEDKNRNKYYNILDNQQRLELLCYLIRSKEFNVSEFLIQKNTTVNKFDTYGKTPIHYASRDEYWDIVELLLRKDAGLKDLNVTQKLKLIHHSVQKSSWDIVKLFIEDNDRNFYLDNINDQKRTELLCYLLRLKDADTSLFILKQGIKVHNSDRNGNKPLHYAAENEIWNIVQILLQNGADFNDLNEKQKSSLMIYSVQSASWDIVKLFMQDKNRNEYFNNIDDKMRVELLCYTIFSKDLKTSKFLIESGTKLNDSDNFGNRPIHYAVRDKNWGITEHLLRKSLSFNELSNEQMHSQLKYSVQHSSWDIIKLFMEQCEGNYYFDNLKDNEKIHYLHYLVSSGNLDLSKYFIEHLIKFKIIPNIDHLNDGEKTFLHVAAENGTLNIVQYLIDEKKADINAVNDQGSTPLHLSVQNDKYDVVRYLTKKGADIYQINKSSKTPIDIAQDKGYNQIEKLLSGLSTSYDLLFHAVLDSNLNTIKCLVGNNTNININSLYKNGLSAFHLATIRGDLDVLKYFKERGANFNLKDRYGNTALHWTSFNNPAPIMRLYLGLENYIYLQRAKQRDKATWYLLLLHKDKVETYHEQCKTGNIKIGDFAQILCSGWGEDPPAVPSISKKNSELDVLKYFLDETDADPFIKNERGNTILHLMVSRNFLEAIKYMIDIKAIDVDLRNGKGSTPLQFAEDIDVVRYLVEKGADVNVKNTAGCTPLHYAAACGFLDIIEYLLEQGSCLDSQNGDGNTPLHLSVANKKFEVVKHLIEKKVNLNIENINGKIAADLATEENIVELFKQVKQDELFHAVSENDTISVCSLISSGVDINARDDNSRTPLHLATISGNLELVKYLLEQGADVLTKNNHDSVLHLAVSREKEEVIKLILNKIIELKGNTNQYIDEKDTEGDTPLMWAAETGSTTATKILLTFGASSEAVNNDGMTALHWAAKNGHLEVAKLLVESGGNIHAVDNSGKKPIHFSAQNDNKNLVEFFLNENVNIDDTGENNWTPLHYAVLSRKVTVIEFLLSQGAKTDALDKDGRTPLSIAKIFDNANLEQDIFSIKDLDISDLKIASALILITKTFNLSINLSLSSLKPYYDLAKLHCYLGQYDDALEVYKAMFIIQKELDELGPQHADTLMTSMNIGICLSKLCKYEEALKILNELNELQTGLKTFGPNHPDTLTTQHNIAEVLYKKGKYSDSLKLYEKVLNKRKEVLGMNHSDVLITRHHIARVLNNQGKHTDALSMFNEIYELQKKILEEDHLDILKTKHNIGFTLFRLKQYQSASTTLQEVLMKRTELLGLNHPDTLTTKHVIALILLLEDRVEEGLNILTTIFEEQEKVLGLNHSDTLATKNDIALALRLQGLQEESLIIFREVYNKRKELLGSNHLYTSYTYSFLGTGDKCSIQ